MHDDSRAARPPSEQRLTRADLAREAETTPERIDRLVSIGALHPGPDGTFGSGDPVRSRVLAAFEDRGYTLEQIATAIRDRAIILDYLHLFYPDPSPVTGRTFTAFVEDLGERGRLLPSVLAALGLPTPAPGSATRVAQEAMLRRLIEGWAVAGDEATLRAARIFGEAARRAAEGWSALFVETVRRPIEAGAASIDEALPQVLAPVTRIAALGPELIGWLVDRHVERSINEISFTTTEQRLVQQGHRSPRQEHPPAVAFVDVSEYTRLTLQGGDELGALTAVRLGELAEAVVRRHGGRVVKLLGDGVLLTFETSSLGLAAVAALAAAVTDAGLPPTHAGIHAGPLIERDGDVYGTTVNEASRIASQATPGAILVSDVVVRECPDDAADFEPVGDIELRGFDAPIPLYRWRGQVAS